MGSLGLFLVFFFLYLPGVSPSLYGGDSGELIAGAYALGIPHAPGYPTYIILSKAAVSLIPFGNAALRINIFSALLSSLLVVMAFRLFCRLRGEAAGSIAAVISAVFLGLTPLYVDQAHSAEVFGLNLVFILGILLCLGRSKSPDLNSAARGWVYLAVFLWGVGLGNHHTILYVGPLLAWIVWRRRGDGWAFWMGCLFFLVLGLSVYLFLPIRARLSPPVNFGDPETWSRFWAVVTRREFGSFSLHPAAVPFRDAGLMGVQLHKFAERCLANLGAAGIALCLIGFMAGMWSRDMRRPVIWVTVAALVFGPVFEIYSNLSPNSSIAQWRLERFFMVPLLCAGFLIFAGLRLFFLRGKMMRGVGLAISVGLFAGQGMTGFPPWSLRDNFSFRDFALSALRSVPHHSWLIIDRVLFDEPTSAMLVRTQVEGSRPDVRFLYRPGTMFNTLYGKDVLDLSWPERLERQKMVEMRLLSGSTSSVRAMAFDKAQVPFPAPQMAGFLYQPGRSRNIPLGTFVLSRWRHGLGNGDFPRRLMNVHFPYLFGKEALDKGEWPLADRFFVSARTLGGDMAWLEANIGSVYAQAKSIGMAAHYFEQAVGHDPYFYEARFGSGYVCLQTGDDAGAVSNFQMAVRLAPDNPDAYYMLGISSERNGQRELARASFEKFLELNPGAPQVDAVREEIKKLR